MGKIDLIPHHATRNIEENKTVLIQINMTYPVLTGEVDGAERDVNLCFAKLAENLVESTQASMLQEARAAAKILPEALPYQIDLTFTSTWSDHGIVSFFTDLYLYAGGLRGITYRYGTVQRLRDNGPLFVTALFPPDADISEFVTNFVASAQKKAQRLDDTQAQHIRAMAHSYYTSENIYLTDLGLAVFYQPHTLSPGVAGIPVFTIPYSDKGPYPPERLVLPERP